jgi:hypothetical protein
MFLAAKHLWYFAVRDHLLVRTSRSYPKNRKSHQSVVDPHQRDPACHFDADAYPDPTFHFDAVPVPDHNLESAQMGFRIHRIHLITMMRIRIIPFNLMRIRSHNTAHQGILNLRTQQTCEKTTREGGH